MRTITIFFILLTLGACASKPPAPLDRIPPGNPSLAEVRSEPERFIGSEVRWGGEIVQVDNKANDTWIEVVGRVLRSDARPDADSQSDGRFIARIPGFADPAVYQTGYLLSVLGKLEAPLTRPIGEFPYLFPVVGVTGSHLWQPDPDIQQTVYPPPWWYHDPWLYYPRPYPYYRW